VLNLDPAKLLVIAVVAVILLGPDKLPQVARQIGTAWRSFGEFRHKMESEVRSSIPDLPSSADIARLARSPSALLDHLSKMDPTVTSGDTPGDESPLTGVPLTAPDTVPPPSKPVPTPLPPHPPDPSHN
jgi:sec-independent protein translocase protein TatB